MWTEEWVSLGNTELSRMGLKKNKYVWFPQKYCTAKIRVFSGSLRETARCLRGHICSGGDTSDTTRNGDADNLVALHFKYDFWHKTATAGSDVVQSGRPIFDDFFQHLWPYIGNNTANVVFQMVKRLWLIRIEQ
ncbi:adhesion G protein-coupled receptor B2 [Trichonephila clavipes]|nr:adhesion G protein-coupled receptor B2 [Trichonephila clavipes]